MIISIIIDANELLHSAKFSRVFIFANFNRSRKYFNLYAPIDRIYNEGSEAFAVRRGDPDTLNVLNNWIRLRWRDGFLKERADFWFRTRDWEDLMPAG